ncbi:MAG: hypothetical protein K6E19_00240 [Lachnospiraceae bacterium]|nr:hypothetical protein [Lachnospiraceae bacterium]
METLMRKVGIRMSILMGITLSLFLSVTNVVMSGHFSWSILLIDIAVAMVVSISLGLVIPMGKLNMSLDKSMGFKPGTIKARLVETFVSDLIYTPIVTVIMIIFNYILITSHVPEGVVIPMAPMMAKGFAVSFVVGYVLIFIFQPLFQKLVFKKYGVHYPFGEEQP